jgi:hypothetical protein
MGSLRGVAVEHSLCGDLSEQLAACQAALRAFAGADGGTRWRGEKSASKILILRSGVSSRSGKRSSAL